MSDEIRAELAAARTDAARLAAEQQAWREHVSDLFERAVAAGVPVEEIVDSLGLSVKWTEHRRRRERLRERMLFFESPGL